MRAAAESGGSIPSLCATDSVKAFGSCRMCLIEVDGMRGTPASFNCIAVEAECVAVVAQGDQTIDVFIGEGQGLVIGPTPSEVVSIPGPMKPDRKEIAFKVNGETRVVTNQLTGGELGGLVRFRKEGAPAGEPKVLLVAPASGHFATLLRGTVQTLLRARLEQLRPMIDIRGLGDTITLVGRRDEITFTTPDLAARGPHEVQAIALVHDAKLTIEEKWVRAGYIAFGSHPIGTVGISLGDAASGIRQGQGITALIEMIGAGIIRAIYRGKQTASAVNVVFLCYVACIVLC